MHWWSGYGWALGEPSASLDQSVEALQKIASCLGLFPSMNYRRGGPVQGMLISPSQSGLEDPVTGRYKVTNPEPDCVRVRRVWAL